MRREEEVGKAAPAAAAPAEVRLPLASAQTAGRRAEEAVCSTPRRSGR